jgi:hypothetical protein
MHPVSGSHLHENGPWDVVANVKLQFKDLLPTSFFILFTGSRRNHIGFPPVHQASQSAQLGTEHEISWSCIFSAAL